MIWIFNPPHVSQFHGVWDRMIGAPRRILESLLLNQKAPLTPEVLTIFFMEVSAILNAKSLVSVLTDPEALQALIPAMLINRKTNSTSHLNISEMHGSKGAVRRSWKSVQHLTDQFWNRWRTKYLQSLQIRQKRSTEDVVLMRDDSLREINSLLQ